MKTAETKNKYGHICGRIAALTLAVLLAVLSLPTDLTYAASNSKKDTKKSTTSTTTAASEDPIREVHNVKVGSKEYCFFVTHYVVITPAEIAKLDDDTKLTDEILKRAGLYMKERNCKLAAHKAIEPAAWKKAGGELFLGDVEIYEEATPETPEEGGSDDGSTDGGSSDGTITPSETTEESGGSMVKVSAIEALRKAAPIDGEPVRLETDVEVTTEKQKEGSDKKPTRYSTYKKDSPNTPPLIYIAVATDSDAKLGEDICKEETSKTKKQTKKTKVATPKATTDEKELLPEERTISMTDRSGGPLEPTLKDGDPVTLEWKEPGKLTDGDKKIGFFDHAWAVPAVIAAALAIILAVILIIRRRDQEESEEE